MDGDRRRAIVRPPDVVGVPEPADGPGSDPEGAVALLTEPLRRALADLQHKRLSRLVKERYDRYQRIGRPHAKKPRPRLRLLRRRGGQVVAG